MIKRIYRWYLSLCINDLHEAMWELSLKQLQDPAPDHRYLRARKRLQRKLYRVQAKLYSS